MKLLHVIVGACALIAAAPAVAGPYVGADYQYDFMGWRDETHVPLHFGGFNAHAGWRLDHVALEGGYEWSGSRHVSVSGETADAFLYWSNDRWSPFVTAGAGHMTAKSTVPIEPFNRTAWGWRAGVGVQDRDLRLAVRYEGLGIHDAHYTIMFNVGLEIGP